MSIYLCGECHKWVDNMIHACKPAVLHPNNVWTCADCGQECHGSVAQHQGECQPPGNEVTVGTLYVPTPVGHIVGQGGMCWCGLTHANSTHPKTLKPPTPWILHKTPKPWILQQTDPSNPEFTKTEVLKGNLEPDGHGGWRRKPRVRPAFDLSEMPRKFWCWKVEVRRVLWSAKLNGADFFFGDFHYDPKHAPYGFGTKASALRRKIDLMKVEAHNVAGGQCEFRVVPHYLGYVPDDEDWYRVAYPEWSGHSTEDRRVSALSWKGHAKYERRKGRPGYRDEFYRVQDSFDA
jgi:hypothetical protein